MTEPIEISRGRKIGERVLRQCDRDGFGPFVAMFAGQTILTKCAESARRNGQAAAWNAFLRDALAVLELPEVSA